MTIERELLDKINECTIAIESSTGVRNLIISMPSYLIKFLIDEFEQDEEKKGYALIKSYIELTKKGSITLFGKVVVPSYENKISIFDEDHPRLGLGNTLIQIEL